ncbi:DEAD/DEAH box helicase [Embleya sp. NPDC008237]|uniref:DEAD/DEAH box helicase n=1 Tax=Embleya sp. NPDC008237 TaxID=3363978 RepID=UPI0036E987F2
MDRTVDRDILAQALGEHTGGMLPDPDRLMSLIAEMEIKVVRAQFDIPDDLLRTAWYLHGVAAAVPGTDLYDLARRRHAFAVSAHVFDLALAGEHSASGQSNASEQSPSRRGDAEARSGGETEGSRSNAERLRLAFAAQAGYRRCEQDPNATAVFRRVEHLVRTDDDLTDHVDTVAVEAGVAFLGMNRAPLSHALRTWRRQFSALRGLTDLRSLRGTMYGPAEAVVDAVHHLHRHLAFGEATDLEQAQALLWSVVDHSAGTGDLWARWVASHLLELTRELAASSLYSCLPSGTPPAVARTFALSEPAVLTLWPPQRRLLSLQHGNPVDPATTRSLISVPTSAGKTLMAQLIICSHLAQAPGRVLYVCPLRSLGREMRQALRARLRLLGRRLAAEQPDFPAAERGTSLTDDVEILTPERLMHALRQDPAAALEDVGLIVVDEAHHMAQGQRGFVLESLLAYCQTHPTSPRLVLLSAAVGNRASLAGWLAPGVHEGHVVFSDDWRGPRRLHGVLSPHLVDDGVVRTPRKPSKNQPGTTRAIVPVAMRLSLRPTPTSQVTRLVTQPLGERRYAERVPRDWKSASKLSGGTADYKLFAAGAAYLTRAGSVLMIVGTRRDARNTALAIAENLGDREKAASLTAFLADTLGPEHPLVACARKGVAFHHGSLPDDVLRAIEDALRTDELLAIASTSTLTDGVNLPVRTVIVHAPVADDRLTYENQRRLTPAQLLNAVGRAGRAGRETEGWLLLTRYRTPTPADFDHMTPGDAHLQVDSALLDPSALEQLAEAEELIRHTTDAVFTLAGTLVADFAAYVWFTLDALTRIPTLTLNDPLRAVRRLLAMHQLDVSIRERWLDLARHVADQYTRTDPITRHRWTTPGTSLGTARVLDGLAERLTQLLLQAAEPPQPHTSTIVFHQPWGPDEWSLRRTLDFLAEHQVFDDLLTLPEVAGAWTFTNRRTLGLPVLVPLSRAIDDWMAGASIPDLATTWLPGVPREWALEQTVDNVSQTFEHALSWVLGALVNLVNERLENTDASTRLRGDTAWYLRHGVDTEQALALLTSGISSRRLAHLVGRRAADEDVHAEDLRGWLTGLHIDGWRSDFHATEYEIADLLEYVRRREGSLFTTLLEQGRATVEVTATEGSEVVDGRVTITRIAADSAVLSVAHQGRSVATVPADSHVDVTAVLDSGLELAFRLEGRRLVITQSGDRLG